MYKIGSASLDVTYKCNLRCNHCFNSSGAPIKCEMSDEKLIEIVESLAHLKVSSLCFFGGETLLKYDVITKMAKKFKDVFPKGAVNLVSNGLLFNREKAEGLKNAGISLIQFSLDGISDDSYDFIRNSNGKLSKVLESITIAKKAGLNVGIACLPHKKNLSEINSIIDYCIEHGVFELRFQPFMPLGRGDDNFNKISLNRDEYKELLKIIDEGKIKILSKSSELKIEWGDPLDHFYMLREVDYIPYININAYGEILLSPYLPLKMWDLNKASLENYIEENIPKNVLGISLVKEVLEGIFSVRDMNLSKFNLPKIFMQENIDLLEMMESGRN
ncbi:radical SAM protein [Paenibacillus sp. FSL R7-0179]|uniref:radical SAM protein n=1 Tax=Paenibacillus sp. FSL R7-0179 TaxID=2921672 RepID=UPI0030FCFF73